jgi:hypothetical protein
LRDEELVEGSQKKLATLAGSPRELFHCICIFVPHLGKYATVGLTPQAETFHVLPTILYQLFFVIPHRLVGLILRGECSRLPE